MNTDYQRIAQAITYIEQHVECQPSLADVANSVHLSPYHFQRLFRRWAGVSPKQFLQYLTVQHAKGLLAQYHSNLDVSESLGLSSSSRLHDQFITLEAMSPGMYKHGGSGLELHHGCYPSPFGQVLLVSSPQGICHLSFSGPAASQSQLTTLKQCWPNASWQDDNQLVNSKSAQIAAELFKLKQPSQTLRIAVTGSNLQLQVWKALLRIPFASATSYGDIAREIGHPRAARAIGTAIASNPVAWLIPCHRVLRRTGEFGQYHWGTERKRLMVGWESAHSQN